MNVDNVGTAALKSYGEFRVSECASQLDGTSDRADYERHYQLINMFTSLIDEPKFWLTEFVVFRMAGGAVNMLAPKILPMSSATQPQTPM